MRKFTASACPFTSFPLAQELYSLSLAAPALSTTDFSNLIATFGSQYILPIVLNAAQLAATAYVPSSAGNATMLIDSTKVVINIVGAGVATLRGKNIAERPTSGTALLRKAEGVTRDVLKIPMMPPVAIPDPSGVVAAPGGVVAVPGGKLRPTVDPASAGDLTDGVPGGWGFTSQSEHL